MHTIETVGRRSSVWGEGPVWFGGSLWHVDIEAHAIVRVDVTTGEETVWNVGQRVGFVLPTAAARMVAGGDHGLFWFDPGSGACEPIVDPEPDLPANRFNDAAIGPDGAIYAGTISLKKLEGSASLYRLDSAGVCCRLFGGVTNSNGIAWSPDGTVCYYIDTPTRKIQTFRFAGGNLTEGGILVDTNAVVDASPDGMCCDGNGNLWVAFCHGGCVVCFDGKSGDALERIEFPCIETTSCCFGGEHRDVLFVTTGIAPGKEEEQGGRLFAVRGLGVSGQEETVYDYRDPSISVP